MPAYNFQPQFVPMILDRSKPHTIRRRRKKPTKVGDMLWLYVGQRTKKSLLIASAPCIDIEPILIYPTDMKIATPKGEMSVDAINRLSRRDGFEDTYAFFEFFKRYKQEILVDFEIIWWSVKQLDVNPLAPIALSGTSPISKPEMGEEEPGVCSLGYNWKAG